MGIQLLSKYRLRRHRHTLWYAVGILLTALAVAPDIYRKVTETLPTGLWWLYWICGSATVGFLAAGTGYLISPRVGRAALTAALVLTIWLSVATVTTAGPGPSSLTLEAFSRAPSNAIKLPFLLQNVVGSLVIIGGALFSFARTRGWYNLWIAAGTIVFAAGGTASGLFKYHQIFYFTQVAGVILLYVGVNLAERAGPRSRLAGSDGPRR